MQIYFSTNYFPRRNISSSFNNYWDNMLYIVYIIRDFFFLLNKHRDVILNIIKGQGSKQIRTSHYKTMAGRCFIYRRSSKIYIFFKIIIGTIGIILGISSKIDLSLVPCEFCKVNKVNLAFWHLRWTWS